jgi:hypothetical protein
MSDVKDKDAPQKRLGASMQRGIDARARLRRQRLVEYLHRLGPAPLGHFLREVENGARITDHLERYSRIDPEFVRALGGDRYPPVLYAIDGDRMRERQKVRPCPQRAN